MHWLRTGAKYTDQINGFHRKMGIIPSRLGKALTWHDKAISGSGKKLGIFTCVGTLKGSGVDVP